jgi:hypothetical protein
MNLGGYFIPAGTIVLRVGQVTSNDVSAQNLPVKAVLWIRIRIWSDRILFTGSGFGSRKNHSGSGSGSGVVETPF